MSDDLKETREKITKFLKEKKNWLIYIILSVIVWFGTKIRLSNLHLLKDVTTGEYIPLALDPFVFFRYAQYIVDHGKLMVHDAMRYVPLGLETAKTSPILSYTIAYLYKIIHFFVPSITLAKVDVLYPVIFFVPTLIIFFFLVKRLFDYKVALLSTAFLAVIPTFLYRTMAGFSDKEAIGLFLMFLALYFYVSAWQSKKLKKSLVYASLAGISTGIMYLVSGIANFIHFIISFFTLIKIFLNKFTKKDFYIFSLWFFIVIFIMLQFDLGWAKVIEPFTLNFITMTSFFVFFVAVVYIYLKNSKIKQKIIDKLPLGIASFLISLFLIFIIILLIKPSFILKTLSDLKENLIHPLGLGRLTLTVSESAKPYFTDWKQDFGLIFFYLFFIGSIFLFFNMVKSIKKYRLILTFLYALCLSGLIFKRYSVLSKIFNGTSTIAIIFYLGSLISFMLIVGALYLIDYHKNRRTSNETSDWGLLINKKYIFIFSWFFIMFMAATGAVRLFLVLTPIAVIIASYFLITMLNYARKFKDKLFKILAFVSIFSLILFPIPPYQGVLIKFAEASSSIAGYTGPSYNQQWQQAMKWVRENTEKDAVFAHWWDYGYWVQTGGNRSTILDGGNFIVYWDYLMGRHVLTAQNKTEALEFLKTHNATHLLIVSDEIGKYPAYSSIGSDENFDRYSWIDIFTTNPNNMQKKEDKITYLFKGATFLDEDLIYNNQLFPRIDAGIIGFFVPTTRSNGRLIVKQPIAILTYNGRKTEIPLECISIGDVNYNFEQPGLKGCIKLIPTIDTNNQINKDIDFPAGALYISERAKRTLWVQLFLLNKKSEYFKEVYNDEASIPLAVYRGRLIGPLKIWEISYPKDIKVKPEYLSTTLKTP